MYRGCLKRFCAYVSHRAVFRKRNAFKIYLPRSRSVEQSCGDTLNAFRDIQDETAHASRAVEYAVILYEGAQFRRAEINLFGVHATRESSVAEVSHPLRHGQNGKRRAVFERAAADMRNAVRQNNAFKISAPRESAVAYFRQAFGNDERSYVKAFERAVIYRCHAVGNYKLFPVLSEVSYHLLSRRVGHEKTLRRIRGVLFVELNAFKHRQVVESSPFYIRAVFARLYALYVRNARERARLYPLYRKVSPLRRKNYAVERIRGRYHRNVQLTVFYKKSEIRQSEKPVFLFRRFPQTQSNRLVLRNGGIAAFGDQSIQDVIHCRELT